MTGRAERPPQPDREVGQPDRGTVLPVLGTPVVTVPVTDAACAVDDDGCITCGDVAVALTVEEVSEYDALCRDANGRTELVATELVEPLSVGDQVLVHAKVALERLTPPDGGSDALR